ncbi:MAG: hypothetical protein R6V25_07065 [Desulfatiglandales bacterium]
MPRRHKPKPGWKPSGFASVKRFSEADFQRMAGALGVDSILPEIRRHIQMASIEYHADLQVILDEPSVPESKAATQKLGNQIGRVLKKVKQSGAKEPFHLEWLYELDDMSKGHLATALARDGALDLIDKQEFTLPEIEELQSAVENVMAWRLAEPRARP